MRPFRISRTLITIVTTALAAAGVAGLSPSAALAGSASVLTWAKQAPAASPPAREAAAMADDGATGTVLLFGGGQDINDNQPDTVDRKSVV